MDLIEAKSEAEVPPSPAARQVLPVSVIVPVRNEARNLPRCLESLAGVGEVHVIDSQSTDDTVAIAQSHGAKVVQFHYAGGWPKKRQWAMDTLPLAYDWILLLDADEVLTPELIGRNSACAAKPPGERIFHSPANVFSRASLAALRCEFLETVALPQRAGTF